MSYTADVSMFPYFKNSTRDQIYSEGYEEGCEEKAQELAEFKNNLKECITKHKQEIEEIEEEKEELAISGSYNEVSMTQYEDMQEDYEEEIQKLKRENEGLKEENKEIRQIEKRCDRFVKKTLEECMKLKEENDILNAYREEQTKIEKIIGDDDLIGRKVEDIVDVAPYIEKLKKEIEKLKDDDDIELWRKDYLAWCKDWMDRNIDGSAMPSESLFNQLQLSMEEDLVNHYNENIKDDDTMNADIKKLWLEIFYDVEEGEDVKNLESVGELYDDIQEYFDKQ